MRYSPTYRDPEAARAYFARARTRRSAGDFDGAWQDFSEGLRLDPDCFTGWSSRAYLLYDLGLWDDAAADFRRAVECRSRGCSDYHRFRAWLCEARSGREAAASRTLREWRNALPGANPWTARIAAFLLGEISESQLLKDADSEQRCEGSFYAASHRLLRGDLAGAKRLFQACRDTGVTSFTEWRSAGFELQRLDKNEKRSA